MKVKGKTGGGGEGDWHARTAAPCPRTDRDRQSRSTTARRPCGYQSPPYDRPTMATWLRPAANPSPGPSFSLDRFGAISQSREMAAKDPSLARLLEIAPDFWKESAIMMESTDMADFRKQWMLLRLQRNARPAKFSESFGLVLATVGLLPVLAFALIVAAILEGMGLNVHPLLVLVGISLLALGFGLWFQRSTAKTHRAALDLANSPVPDHVFRFKPVGAFRFRLTHLMILIAESVGWIFLFSVLRGKPWTSSEWPLMAVLQLVLVGIGLLVASVLNRAGERKGWSTGEVSFLVLMAGCLFIPAGMLLIYVMLGYHLVFWLPWLTVGALFVAGFWCLANRVLGDPAGERRKRERLLRTRRKIWNAGALENDEGPLQCHDQPTVATNLETRNQSRCPRQMIPTGRA